MALTTVARMKSLIGIKPDDVSQDSKLEFYIDAASEVIEGMTGRVFSLQWYTETVSGTGANALTTMHYPIVGVDTLAVAADHSFTNPIAFLQFGEYGISENNSQIVSYAGGFARGRNNIQYTYQAGYAVIPRDIELACAWCVEWYYYSNQRKDIGRTSKSKGDESTSIADTMPPMIREIIQRYKRYEIPNVYQSVRLA